MRITLMHNPSAGDAQLSADDLRDILEEAGYQVQYQSTKERWKSALQSPGEFVVVAGGDGTVKKVLRALAGSRTPCAILPLGTANNIAKALGIAGDAREIVAGWRDGRRRPFDIGVVSVSQGERRFVESAGGGTFADLIYRGETEVEEAASLLGRETDRALHLLRRILEESRPQRWEIHLDGRDLSGEYVGVEALNIRFGGPNVPLAPEADPGDGFLDVVAIGERERQALLDYATERLEEGSGARPELQVHRGRSLHAVPPMGSRVHVDDRAWSRTRGDDERRPGESRDAERGAFDVILRHAAVEILDHR